MLLVLGVTRGHLVLQAKMVSLDNQELRERLDLVAQLVWREYKAAQELQVV